jgi:hypothetical protein
VKPGVRWPLFLAGLLVAQVILGVVFFVIATSDSSFAVEEDYYQKALDWDEQRRRDETSQALGWSVVHELWRDPAPGSPTWIESRIDDAEGNPVSGATVSLVAFHNANAADVLELTLTESAPGRYRATGPFRTAGRWELRLTARRDGDVFTTRGTTHLEIFDREPSP